MQILRSFCVCVYVCPCRLLITDIEKRRGEFHDHFELFKLRHYDSPEEMAPVILYE